MIAPCEGTQDSLEAMDSGLQVLDSGLLGCVHTWCPGTGARVRYLLGTNVNTRFFQVPTPESGHGRVPEYKVKTLYSGTYVCTWSLCARVFPWFQGTFTHNPLLYIPITPCYSPFANMALASDGAKWTKGEITAVIDAYSDAKTSANPMTTNIDFYRSIECGQSTILCPLPGTSAWAPSVNAPLVS